MLALEHQAPSHWEGKSVNRRTLLSASVGVAAVSLMGSRVSAQTPADASDIIAMELTDTAIILPEEIAAGFYRVTNTNTGASTESHSVVARLPDGMTKEEFDVIFAADDDAGFDFLHVDGLGFPDWPAPNATVSGFIQLTPGLHFAFDPFGARGLTYMNVTGDLPAESTAGESDLQFTLGEMVINMPKGPILAGQARWEISNLGALTHELAVLAVPTGFTFDDLMALLMLDETATPTPDMKVIDYQPLAAIGLLGPGRTSVLEVDLAPASHYMAVCMFPDDQGMPHAMTGMYAFFDIA